MWSARFHPFGLIANRDGTGSWYLLGHPEPLPPAETDAPPRIFEPNGVPLQHAQMEGLAEAASRLPGA